MRRQADTNLTGTADQTSDSNRRRRSELWAFDSWNVHFDRQPVRVSVRATQALAKSGTVSADITLGCKSPHGQSSSFSRGLAAAAGLSGARFPAGTNIRRYRYSFSYFWRHWVSSARRTREFYDREGRETFYIGGPHSPWQLCVYQKTESVVRIEFKLRSVFLAAHGIRRAEDLLRLRDVDVWELVSFPEFHGPSLSSALDVSRNFFGKELLLQSPARWPIQTLIGFLRRRGHIDPAGLIRPSSAQWQLRRMQTNMIW